jgi:hypothetical protein
VRQAVNGLTVLDGLDQGYWRSLPHGTTCVSVST